MTPPSESPAALLPKLETLLSNWRTMAAQTARDGVNAPPYYKGMSNAQYACAIDLAKAIESSPAPAASDSRGVDGYVRVPRKPTEAMCDAARHWQTRFYVCDPMGDRNAFYDGIYRAMLAAAPAPPAVASGEHWRAAIAEWGTTPEAGNIELETNLSWIENRARELAEGKK